MPSSMGVKLSVAAMVGGSLAIYIILCEPSMLSMVGNGKGQLC